MIRRDYRAAGGYSVALQVVADLRIDHCVKDEWIMIEEQRP
jgi:hypothetical protein